MLLEYKKEIVDIENAWEEYRMVLDEWNSNLNRNLLNCKVYLNEKSHTQFEEIHKKIRSIGSSLDKVKREEDYENSLEDIKKEFDKINLMIEQFYKDGIDTINLI